MDLMGMDGNSSIEKHIATIGSQGEGTLYLLFRLENMKKAALSLLFQGPGGKKTGGVILSRNHVAALRRELETAESLFQQADEAMAEKKYLDHDLKSEIDKLIDPAPDA